MGIKDFFSNRSETSERHSNDALKTHYFKATKEQAFTEAKAVLQKHYKGEVVSNSPERGEFVYQVKSPKKALIVVTVVSVRAYKTAVDFSVSTETPLPVDFGYSKKVIGTVYSDIQNKLTLIGTGISEQF
ncbi:cytosolic protein [Alkalihalobacillus macyae]|uniref:cytosolic protein n=1 Tax=Guptibacillus hwajinpoensis TaxID=208199 RepID=UPI00273BE50F|nr:cytosolic protein [Alkalihalobacillus macyae]MDP4550882.1 cytosolic protein [Alkalihalobacillus macyae]